MTKGITAGCDKYANSVQSVAIKKRKQAIGIDLISWKSNPITRASLFSNRMRGNALC